MCRETIASEAHGEPLLEQQEQQQQKEEIDTNNSNSNSSIAREDTYLCMLPHVRPRRSVSPQRYSSWDTSQMQLAWGAHFCITFLVLLYGSIINDNRKYISVDPSSVPGDCARAFVDVYASSDSEEDAIICCSANHHYNGLLGICDHTPNYLLFARRLSQFPEAWLLPIFPLLLRGLVRLFQLMNGTLPAGDTSLSAVPSTSTTIRRLALYFTCLLSRGVVLYSLFNFIEHLVVSTPTTNDNEPCWYRHLLKIFQTPCTGKAFDFSDHVVLYFAQLMPVALSETMYCLRVPFWKKENKVTPFILVVGLFYLYFITFLGAYKTSAYFHTPTEIFTGWAVSLLVQIPLCLLQCSPTWRERRSYIFAQPGAGYNTLLIQAK